MASADESADDDDDQDDRLPETTAQKFMRLLEQEMLDGRGEVRLRAWAVGLGIPDQTFTQMFAAIKDSWKQPQLSVGSFIELRDLQHARYLSIYRKAMKVGHLSTAVKAVASIVDLLGLAQPGQLQIMLSEEQGAPQGVITNSAREQVAKLVEKMKRMAAERGLVSAKIENAMLQLEQKMGSNGHSRGRDITQVIDANSVEKLDEDDGGS